MNVGVYKFPDVLPALGSGRIGVAVVGSIYDSESDVLVSLRSLVFQEGQILMDGNAIWNDTLEWYTQCQFCNTKYHTRNMLIIIDGEIKTVMCPKCYNKLVLE